MLFQSIRLMGALFLASAALTAQAGQLTAYSSASADTLKLYADQFAKSHPNIKVNWVRDSTGIITAKLLAEKARPQADAVWGLAASSLAILDQQGMLQSYAPKDLDKIGKNYRDAANPPA